MKAPLSFRFAFGRFAMAGCAFILLLALGLAPSGARAQQQPGLSSDGNDYFLGMMPGIPKHESWQIGGDQYFLITSYFDNNPVTVGYFSPTVQTNGSHEIAGGKQFVLSKGQSEQFLIDHASMTPSYPGETIEYKAAHIHSKFPISVQYYSDGSSNGSLYQGIPTDALGTSYVVSAWNDSPTADAPNPQNADSASSEFEIIAPYDGTTVTFTPNSTTYSGVIGCKSGAGSNGTPHPVTISLNRGEVYWVRSLPEDISDDMSGSTITSDKPVAVLGGCELMHNGDMAAFDENILNESVEEMTPVESWGSDYPSIPIMPASNTGCNQDGNGDFYRIYTADPNGSAVNMWDGTQQYGPEPLGSYMNPPQNWQNVEDPVDLVTDPGSKDASGNLKKIYVVQNLYFQGIPSDEESDRAPEEMNIIPINQYRMSCAFKIPSNPTYHGAQYINIITNRDSLQKIYIYFNNSPAASLLAYGPKKQYDIPLHPELKGLTFQVTTGSYLITGNTPFGSYSYGRTEPLQKDVWGYAAPIGQGYGSHQGPGPKADVTPSCGEWDIHVYEDDPTSEGIANVVLLVDPDGFIARPARVSTNCRLPIDPTLPPFYAGQKSLDFSVQVDDPTQPADAYVFVLDRAGNDTVIHLSYVPPQVALSETKVNFPAGSMVGTQLSSTFTFHVNATGNFASMAITDSLENLDPDFTITSIPALPATLKTGDSVVFTVSFSSLDTNVHKDSLKLLAGACLDTTVYTVAKELTPIIWAQDQDFGSVPVGDTVCYNIYVRNEGDANLILDNNWKLHLNPDYTFKGTLPDTIRPGLRDDTLHFCFHPSTTGSSNSQMNWGSNLNSVYAGDIKDSSVLLGYGIAPGMNWDRHNQLFTVECDASDTVRVYLKNPSTASGGENISVNDIHLTGPNASEFTILDYNNNQYSAFQPFQLLKNDSIPVDVLFKADLSSNNFGTRLAQIVANGLDDASIKHTDTIQFTGIVRHAIVTVTPASYDFGPQNPDTVLTTTFILTNTGDTGFVYTGLNLNGSDFKILSGPALGDTLQPGQIDTITLQYTAKATGGISTAHIAIGGDYPNCNTLSIDSKGLSEGVTVAETPVTYPVTYICHDNLASITASNTGTVGVLLDSVQIIDTIGGAANQFAFTSNASQLIIPMIGVDTGTTVTYPILYTPSSNDSVMAIAVFYWEDTSKGQHRYFQDEKLITGVGYATTNIVSLQNQAATNTYTAVTANELSIPVRLVLPFDPIAQVYGVQFTIRYYRDAFVFEAPVIPKNGLTVVKATAIDDPTNNNYELLTVQLGSLTPIVDSGAMATVSWEYVIGKDSISPFNVGDVMFLDNTGASECWVDTATQPTQFYGQNLCGDATLRMYLHGGMPAFSIQGVTPNPVRHTANVYYKVAEDGVPVTMQVFNALGQPVVTLMKDEPHAVGSYSVTMDASQLPSGLYTVYISTPGFGISKQVVVTK